MSEIAVETEVESCLHEIQDLLGEDAIAIQPTSRPIGQIPGFDSLCAVEATVMLEERLGVPLGENIFVSDDGRKARTLEQIINRCKEALKEKQAADG